MYRCSIEIYLETAAVIFVILCVGLQVINVYGGQARYEQLQLLLIEYGDEIFGYNIIEPFQKSIQLQNRITQFVKEIGQN